MTTHLWVLTVALGVTALLDWGAVVRGDHMVERLTKPLVTALVMGLAWSLSWEGSAADSPPLLPVVVALTFSLIGDIALLTATSVRFKVGLGAFLLAHVAYVWAILQMPDVGGFPWLVLPAVAGLVLHFGRFGRDIVRHAGSIKVAVLLYQLALSVLVVVAAARGDWLLLLGCVVFVVSDTILGHDRFVHEWRWAPLATMMTYHAAQVLIVVGLFR